MTVLGEENAVFGVFRGVYAYLDRFGIVSDPCTALPCTVLDLVGAQIELHGGHVMDALSDACTHVVMDGARLDNLGEIRGKDRAMRRGPHIVTAEWVTRSAAMKRRLPEDAFRL